MRRSRERTCPVEVFSGQTHFSLFRHMCQEAKADLRMQNPPPHPQATAWYFHHVFNGQRRESDPWAPSSQPLRSPPTVQMRLSVHMPPEMLPAALQLTVRGSGGSVIRIKGQEQDVRGATRLTPSQQNRNPGTMCVTPLFHQKIDVMGSIAF